MGKTVLLTLTGRQRDGTGEENITKITARAEYYEKNGAIYLLYEEVPDKDSPIVHNRIKYKNNMLELNRKGAVNTRMVFESGKEHMTDYVTPYGSLQLGILTHFIGMFPPDKSANPADSGDRIIIRVCYCLSAQGQHISDCEMEIIIDFKGM